MGHEVGKVDGRKMRPYEGLFADPENGGAGRDEVGEDVLRGGDRDVEALLATFLAQPLDCLLELHHPTHVILLPQRSNSYDRAVVRAGGPGGTPAR